MQRKKYKWSKSIQLFCLSFLGAFTFWSYTGVLTSLSAVNSISVPVKSLDDFQKMSNFKLYIPGGGTTQTLLKKWAESDDWKLYAFKNFIKTGLEDSSKIKEILKDILTEGGGSNTALLLGSDETLLMKSEPIFEC